MPKVDKSLRAIADEWGVSHEKIRKLRQAGVDIQNPNELGKHLVSQNKNNSQSRRQAAENQADQTQGLEAAIERLKAAEVAAHSDYLAETNPALKGMALKNWNSILDSLRKISVENPEILKAEAQTIDRADLEMTLRFLFGGLKLDLEALADKLSVELQGKSGADIAQIVAGHTALVLSSLKTCKYLGAGD